MRKTFLAFLAVLFMAPMLSGCFYHPYWHDWDGRGHGHGRGYHDDRDRHHPRDDYRDYRERR